MRRRCSAFRFAPNDYRLPFPAARWNAAQSPAKRTDFPPSVPSSPAHPYLGSKHCLEIATFRFSCENRNARGIVLFPPRLLFTPGISAGFVVGIALFLNRHRFPRENPKPDISTDDKPKRRTQSSLVGARQTSVTEANSWKRIENEVRKKIAEILF